MRGSGQDQDLLHICAKDGGLGQGSGGGMGRSWWLLIGVGGKEEEGGDKVSLGPWGLICSIRRTGTG